MFTDVMLLLIFLVLLFIAYTLYSMGKMVMLIGRILSSPRRAASVVMKEASVPFTAKVAIGRLAVAGIIRHFTR